MSADFNPIDSSSFAVLRCAKILSPAQPGNGAHTLKTGFFRQKSYFYFSNAQEFGVEAQILASPYIRPKKQTDLNRSKRV